MTFCSRSRPHQRQLPRWSNLACENSAGGPLQAQSIQIEPFDYFHIQSFHQNFMQIMLYSRTEKSVEKMVVIQVQIETAKESLSVVAF